VKRLQSDRNANAIAILLQIVANRLHSDSIAIAMQCNGNVTVMRLQSDRKEITGDLKPIETRWQSECKATAKQLQ
jgi:hypothetical protein